VGVNGDEMTTQGTRDGTATGHLWIAEAVTVPARRETVSRQV